MLHQKNKTKRKKKDLQDPYICILLGFFSLVENVMIEQTFCFMPKARLENFSLYGFGSLSYKTSLKA